jgi:hypothetical protein
MESDAKGKCDMSEEDQYFLYDETEDTQIRFVSFVGETNRFDLAIVGTERFYGKKLVLDIQSNRFAVIGADDLEAPGYLEHAYRLSEEEARELKDFLHEVIL